MKVIMLVLVEEVDPSDVGHDVPDIEGWVEDNDVSGVRVMGERLRPAAQAPTVRVRTGELVVTDGPFAEAHNSIVGFDILECESMEHAVEVAAAHPMAYQGALELRESWPIDPDRH